MRSIVGIVLLLLASRTTIAGYVYVTNSPDTENVTISGYTGTPVDLDIPLTNADGKFVTRIGDSAFMNSVLKSVVITNVVTNIGPSAFRSCSFITNAVIGSNVSSISEFPFRTATNLLAITVDENNASYCSTNGWLLSKDKTVFVQCPGGWFGELKIPNGVTCILERAVTYSVNITNLVFPETVTSILGNNAVASCKHLYNLTFPKGITSITGTYLVGWCTSLTNVTLFDGITNLGSLTFYGCTNLKTAVLPNTLTYLSYGMFAECSTLTNVVLPLNVTTFGEYSVTEPPPVTTNGTMRDWGVSFGYCNKLTSEIIPVGVTSLCESTFINCYAMTGIYFRGNAPWLGTNAFKNCTNATVYRLPGSTGFGTNFGGRPVNIWAVPHGNWRGTFDDMYFSGN